uniref:Putative capsid protein n=1 Tax=Prunella montanella CRESS-DNA-virus sp. TaxID=2815056 RepID=A0A8A4XBG9_9VIRU|nr:MAG: putative capsid protein [Prunella montanella CRESS-DNA-virus sp.]
MGGKRHRMHAAWHDPVTNSNHSWNSHNTHKRHKVHHNSTRMDTNMTNDDGARDEGNQKEAFMIPGVDGKLQFGFPTKIITILRYFDHYPLTSTSGGIATQIMRMNGPRDPDVTGVGHQPLYWDRYAAIYQSYRVLGSRVTASISATTASSTQGPWAFGINGSTVATTLGTSVRNREEQNDAVSTLYNGQSTITTLSYAYSPEIKLGRPNGDDTVGAFVSNDPSVQYYAHIWVADLNGATSTANMKVGVEYTIEFYGLVQEAES